MYDVFMLHNQFKESIERFENFDPHLKRIEGLPFSYKSPLVQEQAFRQAGVYLISGGRQVGKTTCLKQLIRILLKEEAVQPEHILFLTGELIDSHHALRRLIEDFVVPMQFQFLFIDEVNYVPDWDKSIKYLADVGCFDSMSVILTGSDSQIIRTAMKRFAGRRGKADQVDFIFHPLSFYETVLLKEASLGPFCESLSSRPLLEESLEYAEHHAVLLNLFHQYLLHGGYLPAIRDFMQEGSIALATLKTYTDWIIGDMLKHGKSEHYLYEILKGVRANYGAQISWNSLARHLSIDHHKTVSDYCQILQDIQVLNIVEALAEHTLSAAVKKSRKLYFRDPFIHFAVRSLLDRDAVDIQRDLKDSEYCAPLVETVVIDHCKRLVKTFYIKGDKGEVDLALVQGKKFYPFEIKWTQQLRSSALKQIQQYPQGAILSKSAGYSAIGPNKVMPILAFLLGFQSKNQI